MKKVYVILLSVLLFSSCNEDKFLKEEALDFMSSDNSFTTVTDFNMSINNLYDLIRVEFYAYDENKPFDYLYGTDLIYDGEYGSVNRHLWLQLIIRQVVSYNSIGMLYLKL